ncbi:MAG: salivary glue protein Sgs-3 [Coriobacteriia bacterium]|nr:salivary glue protein Sgs-3 [Coriobacteriia bacterium]
MSEETKTETAAPKKNNKKLFIIIGILLVIAAAGSGAWIWHEQPSFCNAFCHVPMDEYYSTYIAEVGEPTFDKYGNAVSDASGMLAATHREAGEGCLDCHVPTIGEMVSEGLAWIPGSYYFPLSERSLDELTAARKLENDEFCMNKKCHHVSSDGTAIDSREALEAATSDLAFNPHASVHGEFDCADCHKAHRASVNICSSPGCHSDAIIPPGWLDVADSLLLDLYLVDPE